MAFSLSPHIPIDVIVQLYKYFSNKVHRRRGLIMNGFTRWFRFGFVLGLLALGSVATVPAQAQGLLYEVTTKANKQSKGGRIWLLGSLHFGSADLYPLPEYIERAFARADYLMVEVNVRALDAAAVTRNVRELGIYRRNDRLSQHISASLWQRTLKVSQQLHLPETTLQVQRPWLAAITLSMAQVQSQGLLAAHGVDQHFLTRASRLGLPILELERFEQQMQLFSSQSAQMQTHMLDSAVSQVEAGGDMPMQLLQAWRVGDGTRLQRLLKQAFERTPQSRMFAKQLLTERNVTMAQGIAQRLQQGGNGFVVLGAAHLFGTSGIVQLLREQGCIVTALSTTAR